MERKKKKAKYSVVSLFSGIGGLDLGFEFAGFKVIWANDFDKYAVETYKKNVNNNIFLGDIRKLKNSIPKHDILIGGFPCQPFSTLGKLQGFNDESRGNLFFDILDVLKNHDTKICVLENVKNLLNHDKGNTFKIIKEELSELGYEVYYKILNSKDFGVPQQRNRIFIVAINSKYFNIKDFVFPNGYMLDVTTQDLLDDLVDDKYFLTKKIVGTIMGEGTKGYIVKPTIDKPISKTLCATMHKMHRASQDNYVTDNVNYERNCNKTKRVNIRKLTPNECRKLQGFPSDWIQVVSDCQAYKQFGNAVTVNVAYEIAKQVYKYLEENLL